MPTTDRRMLTYLIAIDTIVVLLISSGERHVYSTITSIEPTLLSHSGRSLSSDEQRVMVTNHERLADWPLTHVPICECVALYYMYTARVKRPWTDGGNIYVREVMRLTMRRRPDVSARACVLERRRYSNSRWFHGRFNVSSIYFSQGCSAVNYIACALHSYGTPSFHELTLRSHRACFSI